MNDSGRSSLRIGAVCAAAIGGVMLTVGMAQTSRTLMEFHGVTPGESSTDSLRAGEWKQVVSQSTTADGMRRLEFHIAPWKKVVVVAKDDRVVGIDLFAPRGLTSQKVRDAFGLGRVMPADQLPPEARFATEGIAGELLESPAAFVLLEMEDQDGLQRVRRIRFFGNRPPAAGRAAEGGRPAPAIQPDPSGRPPAAVAPFNVQQAGAHQQAWAKYLGQPVEVTNSIGMKLRLIPPGEFMMGSPAGDSIANDHQRPQHQVRITQPFYLGMTEVTQGQWRSVMGTEPWKDESSVKEGSDYAATNVSWKDAVAFCEKLSEKEGSSYRLPTEAEWEYACRGGTSSVYSFGDDDSGLGDYAWFSNNTYNVDEKYAHVVGQKKPNPWGLYDMHGNVWEWCSDWYHKDYYSGSPGSDPTGPASGSARVRRGGSWMGGTWRCRSAYRLWYNPSYRYANLGFRVAFSPAAAPGK